MNIATRFSVLCAGCLVWSALGDTFVQAQQPVTIKVEFAQSTVSEKQHGTRGGDVSDVAAWLVPLDQSPARPRAASPLKPVLSQKNKTFEPHMLVVSVGTVVLFPNKDPFFHNVFSLFDGRRFDLGLYEAGSAKSVRFDRPGISLIFCNIHPQMTGVVVTVNTPYYGISDGDGRVSIADVPNGRYQLLLWSERSTPESLKSAERVVNISDSSREFGPIRILKNPEFTLAHKNKYGQDYAVPSNPDYLPH